MMSAWGVETAPQRYARVGGALYLAVIVLGIRAELVRVRLVAPAPAITATNLLTHQTLWRAGVAADLASLVGATLLAMIYYVLLKPVSRELNLAATFLRLVGIVTQAIAVLCLMAALFPLGTSASATGFTPAQLDTLVAYAIRAHAYAFGLALLFFGACFLIHGLLIARSRFLPAVLGVLIQIAGVCYLVNSLALFLAPAFENRIFPAILLPSFIGEASLCLWLLIKGVDAMKWREVARGG
ncbi:MAG TPA: DUF4386 domain-containing protein [Vicinamibacterales bacterium]|nr:DUF4386 domain-containing protein [Vicinamibacterales bacterium]